VKMDCYEIEALLKVILAWEMEQNKPTHSRMYHCCPICGATWWRNESHSPDCWVPRLKEIVGVR